MNRQSFQQLKTQLQQRVQYVQPPDWQGMWGWTSGPYNSRSGVPSKSAAQQDFQLFLDRDLRKETEMKSRGTQESLKVATIKVRPRSHGNYPDEILDIALEIEEGSPKAVAVKACNHAKQMGIVGRVDQDLIRQVERDLVELYRQQKAA